MYNVNMCVVYPSIGMTHLALPVGLRPLGAMPKVCEGEAIWEIIGPTESGRATNHTFLTPKSQHVPCCRQQGTESVLLQTTISFLRQSTGSLAKEPKSSIRKGSDKGTKTRPPTTKYFGGSGGSWRTSGRTAESFMRRSCLGLENFLGTAETARYPQLHLSPKHPTLEALNCPSSFPFGSLLGLPGVPF